MQYVIIVIMSLLVIAAVSEAGSRRLNPRPVKLRVRVRAKRQPLTRVNVNVNNRKVRTIVVRSYSRKVSA